MSIYLGVGGRHSIENGSALPKGVFHSTTCRAIKQRGKCDLLATATTSVILTGVDGQRALLEIIHKPLEAD